MNQYEYNDNRNKEVLLYILESLLFMCLAVIDVARAAIVFAILFGLTAVLTVRNVLRDQKEYYEDPRVNWVKGW